MFREVCRLCLGTDDLIWVFNEKMADNMKEIIEVTSGVEISKSDTVTQMVCSTCCQVTIKMYQFRTKSIKNDKDLKARCVGYNISQLTNCVPPVPQKPESVVTPSITIKPIITPTTPPITIPSKYKFAHPSVKEVVKKFPNINLPSDCLKSHVGAYITLLTDEVDEWYKEKNYTDEQIAMMKKNAAEMEGNSEEIASAKKRKKTEPKPRPTSPVNSNKKIKLRSDSSDKHLKRKVRDKSDSDASSVVSVNSVKSDSNAKINKRTSSERGRTKTIKTRSSGTGAKNIDVQCKTDVIEISDSPSNDLLVSSDAKRTNASEEITLKSLLRTSKFKTSDVQSEFIEIEDSPSDQSRKAQSKKPKQNIQSDSVPIGEDDVNLFSSRPFLRDSTPLDTFENASNKNKEYTDEVILIDVDSRSSSDSELRFNENDKTSFAKALELAPTLSESNLPDLSLVSLANKSYTLHTCKVCDSQHTSLKDLRYHMKRMHTKCPFCTKRFKTSALRDEHIKNTCSINARPIKLKEVRLNLVRVDEDEELSITYARAFNEFSENNEEDVVREDKSTEEVDVVNRSESTGNKEAVEYDTATVDAIDQLEKFLNDCESIPVEANPANTDEANISNQQETVNKADDVICISDDESEIAKVAEKPNEPTDTIQKINVVNSDILAHINIHDNEVNILKQILHESRLKLMLKDRNLTWSSQNNAIINGNNDRVKIFKNLRKYLQQYKVPIEVKHSPIVSVEYTKTELPTTKKCFNLWNYMKPIELKNYEAPKPTTYTILNGQIGNNMNSVNASSSNMITNTPVIQNTVLAPMQLKPTVSTVQPKMVSTANLLLTSSSVMSNTSASSAPVLLNGTKNVSNTQYTNIILVPNSLLTVPSTQGPLPVITSVTSAVEEITNDQPSSTKLAQLESITNSLMPTSTTNNCDAVVSVATGVANPSGIRVKNLKELS